MTDKYKVYEYGEAKNEGRSEIVEAGSKEEAIKKSSFQEWGATAHKIENPIKDIFKETVLIMDKLATFAGKKVRQDKRGYLILAKCLSRDSDLIPKKAMQSLGNQLKEFFDLGYTIDDLRFFWRNSPDSYPWYEHLYLCVENKMTKNVTTMLCPVDLSFEKIERNWDNENKDRVKQATDLQKQIKEEENWARQILKNEIEQYKQKIAELENQLKDKNERS